MVKYGLNLYVMYFENDKCYSCIWNCIFCMLLLGIFYDEDGNLVDYLLGDGNMNLLVDMGED